MGSDKVAAGMKEYAHSPRYSGLKMAGVFEGMDPLTFKGDVSAVGNAPPFKRKAIDKRMDPAYKASLQRDALRELTLSSRALRRIPKI